MPSASDTAYPLLKADPTDKELAEVYTPTESELAFARRRTNQPVPRIGLLLLLKTFQRLGYFVTFATDPRPYCSPRRSLCRLSRGCGTAAHI